MINPLIYSLIYSYLLLTISYYYPHFTNEEIEAYGALSNLFLMKID